MANRPVYEAITKAPFYQVVNVDFEYFPGFAVCQKQKSVNCQAKAAAVYVGLVKSGLLSEALASEEDFLKTLYGHA